MEACSDYTTDGFIAAYKLFAVRSGISTFLYRNCDINFVGADKQLRPLFDETSAVSATINRYLTDNRTKWRFNPSVAPPFGGLWEAAARSVNHHLLRVVRDTTSTFEEMTIFLTQMEACLNSRPLQAQSDDLSDVVPLTLSRIDYNTGNIPERCMRISEPDGFLNTCKNFKLVRGDRDLGL